MNPEPLERLKARELLAECGGDVYLAMRQCAYEQYRAEGSRDEHGVEAWERVKLALSRMIQPSIG